MVMGKRMEDQLRFAVCYWHSFCWNGFDPFGYDGTFERPWQKPVGLMADPMAAAKAKADAAFEFFQKLGAPYYCFHDRDVAPEGATLAESNKIFDAVADELEKLQKATGKESLAEVVRDAIHVYSSLFVAREQGVELLFESSETGEKGRVWLLPGPPPLTKPTPKKRS